MQEMSRDEVKSEQNKPIYFKAKNAKGHKGKEKLLFKQKKPQKANKKKVDRKDSLLEQAK